MGWILDNLFLVIIIISGLITFLGDSKRKQEEQKKSSLHLQKIRRSPDKGSSVPHKR